MMTRRIFLKRASQATGILVMLPAARAIGKLAPNGTAYYEHTIVAMGTTARIGVYAASEEQANHVITATFDELKRLESLFTIFSEASELSAINRAAGGERVQVSSDTLSILRSSIACSVLTSSAFDITVEPLMRLWGFRNESNKLERLPTPEKIARALQFVGYDQIRIDDSRVGLRSAGAKLDLGGVAVGNALDEMIAIIRAANIENAFIDISGDMFALGAPEGKRAWEVAIPDPQNTSRLIYKTGITNEALATSGNYMSFVTYQARQYGHIMDTHEGRSAHKVLSATVIAHTGLDADSLSTASFVTGEQYAGHRLVLVDRLGRIKHRA